MGILAAVLLAVIAGDLLHSQIDAQEAFVRSAVESPPLPYASEKFALEPDHVHIGDEFLPLRSAVESVPIQKTSTSRTFIRSSVEHRPIESEQIRVLSETAKQTASQSSSSSSSGLSTMRQSDRYSAFKIPSQYGRAPAPFRAGSPYQELFKHTDSQQFEQMQTAASHESRVGYFAQSAALKANDEPKKVLCYVTNWSFYRLGDGKFVPEHIQSELCSHVIYSFGSLDPQTLRIKEFDPWADVQNNLYRRTTALPVKTLLALGGWTDSTGDKYSRLISSAAQIRSFVDSTVVYLQKYGFSGLHMDWNYPRCWQSDCRKGPAVDRPNFTRLIQALATTFRKQSPPLELGVAISGYKEVIAEAYEVAKLSQAADFLTVMTYDYHGAWESETGHVSPLYAQPNDKYPQYNTDYTMQLLLKEGADREKLIMGVPFYGQTYTLDQSYAQVVGEGIPARGPGNPGAFTRQPGMMAYYEICDQLRKKKLMSGRAKTATKMGQHASLRDQWVGYEDPNSISFKTEYVMKQGFAGIAAWTIDLDDFHNTCCYEAFPLLRAVNRGLGRLQTSAPPAAGDCRRPEEPVTPVAPVMEASGEHGGGHHEHTTWQEWKPSSTTPTTPAQTTTTTTSRPSTWWTQPTTTQRTTTVKPTTTTTTTVKPVTWWTKPSTTTTTSTTTYRPPSTQPPSIPGPVNTQPIVIEGERCSINEYRAHPRNCNAYFRCVFGTMTLLQCAGNLHWNSRDQLCDWPARANCKLSQNEDVVTSTSTTRRPTTTTTPTRRTTTARTTTTPRTTTQRTTPTRPATARPTKATTTQRPKPTQRPGRPPVQSAPPSQSCAPGNYYPHPDCSRFYVCVNNKLIAQDCGPGLQWSQQQLGCDRADAVKCVSRTHKFMRLVSARIAPDDLCEGNVHISYPGVCDKYLLCNHGQLQMGECAPGLHWNERQQICDWPLSAQCREDAGGVDGGDNNHLPDVDKPVYSPPATTTTSRPTTTTTRKPTTPRPPLTPHSGHYKLVCYFTNWAWYRQGVGKYTPDHIDTELCTHIVYGFAVLDYSELTIRTHDSWADIDNKFYARVAILREKGVKVSLALGGWNDSQGDKYSRLVRSAASRAKFVRQAIEFIERYGFEGLDLDWEYPVCWQTECKKGFADEKEGFAALVRELSDEMRPKGLLLSTAVSPSKQIIDAGYDVSTISKYFDWIAVMTYDFHGQWDKKTGHVAPLYYHEDDDISYFNANFSINYWMEKGAPARKLVMGMPLYGQSFTLSDPKNTGLNSKAPGPGQAGEYTRAAGFLAYYEICDRVRNRNWEVVQDPKGRMGPYAFKGNQWVSFDDKQMLIRKSKMIRELGLGGGMVWALDLDDFKNHCGEGAHPLLTEIQRVLRDPPQPDESSAIAIPVWDAKPPPSQPSQPLLPDYSSELSPSQPDTHPTQDGPDDASVEIHEQAPPQPQLQPTGATDSEFEVSIDNEISGETPDADYKVVCYFTNWAWYRQGGGKFLPEDIDAQLCTHVIYGFAVLNRETLTIQPHDSWADIDNRFYERVVAYKAKGIKVSVAIGGWNDSAGDKYSRLVRSAASRSRFIKHIMQFIEKYDFDGLDLDWEYPVCWQVDCKKGFADEKQGFAALVRELSVAFRPRGWLLSSAVSPSQKVIDAAYDVPVLSKYMDWIAVMTYDYHGQWDKQTGHVAPMYEHEDDFDTTFNANYSINYWINSGADREKLVMGMPMYGQSFSLADRNKNQLNQPTYGGGEAGEETRARGFLSYYEICERVQQRGWTVVRDRQGRMGPYAYKGDQWVSFDDGNMIRHKSEFVRAMGLGGAMIWALDLDDFRNVCGCEEYPMLRTINRVLRGYGSTRKTCQLLEQTMEAAPNDIVPAYSRPAVRPQIVTATQKPKLPPTMVTQQNPPAFSYDCGKQQFRAHSSDCNKYYQCQFGSLLEQSCPPGLHWNRDHCDWPGTTNCQSASDADGENVIVDVRPTKRPSAPLVTATKKPNNTPRPATTQRPMTSPPKPNPTFVKPPPTSTVANNDVNGPRVVCYFTNWAWYRKGDGKYTPDHIDDSLCTHIVYGFAVLSRDSLTIRTHDSWADVDNKFYERVVALRAKGLRVTLAIGGWNDSLGDKYARLVLNSTARAQFVRHAVEFIGKYGFEGLDLDWEYPVCWQVDCSKGQPAEKQGFAALVRELSAAFKPKGWLLSAAVSASKKVIDAAYDVPTMAKYMDWIAVMAYDYHGHWDKQTGHVAPLYALPDDADQHFNANFSMRYYIAKGAPPKKLILGVPFYGQSFSVASAPAAKRIGLNTKATGPGQAGKFTRAAGFVAYYEICERINAGGWTVVRDAAGRIGPYAHRGDQWFSYDDVDDIRRKAQFARELGLGGAMVWALDLDDFRGRCGCGKHPLLRALNQELGLIEGQRASDCT